MDAVRDAFAAVAAACGVDISERAIDKAICKQVRQQDMPATTSMKLEQQVMVAGEAGTSSSSSSSSQLLRQITCNTFEE